MKESCVPCVLGHYKPLKYLPVKPSAYSCNTVWQDGEEVILAGAELCKSSF